MIDQNHAIRLPAFFMSSVPKSGTHLLHQLLNGIPGVKMDINDSSKKFFLDAVVARASYFEEVFHDHSSRLKMLSDDEFGLAHVRYSVRYADMFDQLNLKHIFLYRDSRDVLVSMAYFIREKWIRHPLHEDFQSKYVTLKDQLVVLIQGVPEKWPDFHTYISGFYRWIQEDNVLKVTFEQLTESESSREAELVKIVGFLYDADYQHVQ
ncbi:sulfotransferase domain-containing protein [Pseudalkalibacillus hwajinpoensis]|uniref:sulfotransferase domain-containing protein n=1 Tax=Guptibacillus hwajinpoensis TaxID=208199 RepID=UPI00325B7353